MNKLVLIGNGFDLAHNLKTKYSDFILDALNKAFEGWRMSPTGLYTSQLITFQLQGRHFNANEFTSIQEFYSFANNQKFEISYASDFIGNMFLFASQYNWVDIEAKYFEALTALYKRTEKAVKPDGVNNDLQKLNYSFELLKNELAIYLSSIDNKLSIPDPEIQDHIQSVLMEVAKINAPSRPAHALFLNFNYTATLNLYVKDNAGWPATIINIHGKLNDPRNPLIFGYGDEMDHYYELIERLNNNEFLKNIKSFGYFKTNFYKQFSNFINGQPFEVLIMGHSCGISDRILLNSIFENPRCKEIRILYHQRSEKDDDFFEKTQEISRHFGAKNKGVMRNIVVSHESCKPLKKFKIS